MSEIETIRRAFVLHEPVLQPAAPARAAVAVVLRSGAAGSAELLLIERARKDGDPWSGHMAFPGGRHDPEDLELRVTAERETLEEVGLDLRGGELLGRLDDLEGRHAGRPAGLVISAFVYHLASAAPLRVQRDEVESAFWVPLPLLSEPARRVDYRFRAEIGPLSMPGIRVGDAESHVVWGLTYRFLESFFGLVGRPWPDRWGEIVR